MVNVGIIGAGHGVRVLAPAIAMLPGAQLTALAARSQTSLNVAQKSLDIGTLTTDWHDLIADPEIDLIAVAVPPSAQPEIARAALGAGKILFLEKPLALHLKDAVEVAVLADHKGLTPAVDFIFPMLAPWQRLHAALRNNAIGPVTNIELEWRTMTYANRHGLESWKTRGGDGGGTLLNFASHTFHYLDWLFGDIASISASLTKSDNDPRDGDTRVKADLVLANDVPVHVDIDAGYADAPCHRLVVYGRDDTLILENATPDYVRGFTFYNKAAPMESTTDIGIEADDGDGRILATSRILAALLETGKPPAGLGVADALKTQRYLDAARVSAETGTPRVAGNDF